MSAPLAVGPLAPGDDAAVRCAFWSTLVLGRPACLPASAALRRYEDLCLGWYLGPGRQDAAAAWSGGRLAGYVLVCTDLAGQRRWRRRPAARYALAAAAALARGGATRDERRFHRARLADGWTLWRTGRAPPMPAEVHLNLLPELRVGLSAARRLVAHADDVCRRAGLAGWFGEVNARAGRRAAALERLGGEVVGQAPNHTLSALAAQPVERLTVVRHLAR